MILVTGGCGFIGANLVRKLVGSNIGVRVFDNLSRETAHYLDGCNVELTQGDIRDASAIEQAANGTTAIVHLAAFGSVIESIADPTENFEVNVRGTLNVLRAALNAGVRRFVFASTGGALIGDAKPPVNEDSLPKPISPYGASKLCGEAYCNAFAAAYGLPTAVLRFANVYGPFSAHKKGAINVFMRAVRQGKPIVIYGDGSASRDFIHVDDLCAGIVLALREDITPATVLHIASGHETTIKQLAATIARIAGKPGHPVLHEPGRRGEVTRNFASYERAHRTLGFEPTISLDEGLTETWRWFNANA